MIAKSICTILHILIFMQLHSQPSIIGNWKLVNWQGKLPDLIIRSDSTFFMRIDTTLHIVKFSVQDSVDYEFKGVWIQPDSQHLTLCSDGENKMFFPYKIIKLTQNKMILKFTFTENQNGLGILTYTRL
ncbi:hypothetical protein BH11BAC3_BH11BAC3_02610 [soil metagenome]